MTVAQVHARHRGVQKPLKSCFSREISKKILLFFFSLFFSLFSGELLMRGFYPQQLIKTEGIWRPDPELGWRHIESARRFINNGERRPVLWVTDENGFRTSPVRKKRGQQPDVSLLMIGDSFLAALALDYEKTIPDRVERYFKKKYSILPRVDNAGVGAWEPGQYLLETRRALKQRHYDMGVIFFYIGNDVIDRLRFKFMPQDISPSKQLRIPSGWTPQAFQKDLILPLNNFLRERSHLFVFLKARLQILLARMGFTDYYFPDIFLRKEANSLKWEATAAMAELIYQEFQQRKIPALFVLLPVNYQVQPQLLTRYRKMFNIPPDSIDLDQPNQKLAAQFQQRSIPFIDMLPLFRENAKKGLKMYGSSDNHLNAEGHDAVTEAILPKVEATLKFKSESFKNSIADTGRQLRLVKLRNRREVQGTRIPSVKPENHRFVDA